jgi:hypothetical protein
MPKKIAKTNQHKKFQREKSLNFPCLCHLKFNTPNIFTQQLQSDVYQPEMIAHPERTYPLWQTICWGRR